MIPRGTLDIEWKDWLFALAACLRPIDRQQAQTQTEETWTTLAVESTRTERAGNLACLSVRSGFDLVLQALQLAPGSEVLVSAVTIPDMVRILEAHGLIVIPIDIDISTLGVNCQQLVQAITPQTRAILVAHLFGSRMNLTEVARIARQHNLLLWEDCAQAYDGASYRGQPESDVCMFSFGTIKTHTALGGAILSFRENGLLEKVRTLQAGYPIQSRKAYLWRLIKLASLTRLAPPPIFTWVVRSCRWLGISHDELLSKVVRGFPGADFFAKIRRQPSAPLLVLLERRLRTGNDRSIEGRVALVKEVTAVASGLVRPGVNALHHVHWVFPILVDDPDQLVQFLWANGFDATRRASSMTVVKATVSQQTDRSDHPVPPLEQAERLMAQTLYLPVYGGMSKQDAQRLGRLLTQFSSTQQYQIQSELIKEQQWILQQ